jgi:hypothetical protein
MSINRISKERIIEGFLTDLKDFIRSLLSSSKAQWVKEVREEIENRKQDDRPEITEWLVSKDHTKGFNQALDDILSLEILEQDDKS